MAVALQLAATPDDTRRAGGVRAGGWRSDFCADACQSLDPRQTPSSSRRRGPTAWRIDQFGEGAQVMRRIENGRDGRDRLDSFRLLPQAARHGMATEEARCHSQPLGSRLRGNDDGAGISVRTHAKLCTPTPSRGYPLRPARHTTLRSSKTNPRIRQPPSATSKVRSTDCSASETFEPRPPKLPPAAFATAFARASKVVRNARRSSALMLEARPCA